MKRPCVHFTTFVACFLTLAAVAASPGAQTGQGIVSGVVKDAVTGAPIAGAVVNVSPGGITALTGGDGAYQATVPAGTISLTVSVQNRPFQSVFGVLVRNGATTTINFTLSFPPSAGLLTGYVRRAATRAPIANAIVSAGGQSTATDVTGRYEFSLPAGTYTLSASAACSGSVSVSGITIASQAITTRDLQLSSSAPDAVVEVVHRFAASADGENPFVLIRATDGDLYGMTITGGDLGGGTIFKMTTAGTFIVLHQFAGLDGQPTGLVQGTDGDLYGITDSTAFKMTLAGNFTILHAFADSVEGFPRTLIQGGDGDFYGTTDWGYPTAQGAVFRMTPDGTVTILRVFVWGIDGFPSGLIQGTDGSFYGTTSSAGPDGGTAFRMTSAGSMTVLHTFTRDSSPFRPFGLIQASDGNFYGLTVAFDGSSNGNRIFRLTPAGDVTVLHSSIGGDYSRTLIQATDGNFYGSSYGIPEEFGAGDLFRLTPAGEFTTLHVFTPFTTGGANPYGDLVEGTDGSFYGVTFWGGIPHQDGRGTLFRLRISSCETPAAILPEMASGGAKASPTVRAKSPSIPLKMGTVAGRVRDSRTNAAVSNALLRFSPGDISVTTDKTGRYALVLPAGTYTVTVSVARARSSSKSGVVVVNRATTALDLLVSRPPAQDPMFSTMRAWDMSTTRRSAATVSPANAGAWEIEAFGGASFASQASGGTVTLPPAGTPFLTATGEPSRRVSSWYLSDGAQLLNGVNAALGVGQQITPLDAALNASIGGSPSGGGGVRVSRRLTLRLTAEVTVEFNAVRPELSSDASAGIEASRASFLSAWEGVASAGQFASTTVTSVETIQIQDGHQIVATGAVNVALKKTGKVIPYVTGGAGIISNSGTSVSAGLVGDYRFVLGGVTPFHETDSVTVRYTVADQVTVGVLGAGFKYLVSPHLGLRVDYRTYLGANGGNTFLESNPSVSTLAPAGSGASATAPGIQFSNDSSIGIQSSLSGPQITDFRTFHGSGMQRHARLTMGLFWRF